MARAARLAYENAFYHVFNRGLDKQNIFQNDHDYSKMLTILADLKKIHDYDHSIYSFVLMPNHFHLLIQTRKTPIATIMKSITIRYVIHFNKIHNHTGILFQNRFKSKLCDRDSYFLGASRYIHLNPLAAKITSDLKAYPWSSYQEIFGSSDFNIIDKQEIERLIGTTKQERDSYKTFIMDGVKNIFKIEKDYAFDKEVGGSERFYTLAQKKFLRRRRIK